MKMYTWRIRSSTQNLARSQRELHTVHTCWLSQAKTTKHVHASKVHKSPPSPTPPLRRKQQLYIVVKCINIYRVRKKLVFMAMYTELEKKSVFMAVYTTPHTHKLERTSHTVSATRMLLFAHHTQSQGQEQLCCHSHITHNCSNRDVKLIAIRTSHTATMMLPFAHHTQSQRQGCCHSHITRMSQVCCHSHLFHVPCLGPLPCVILVDGELKAMLQ